jgi:hypothetical protein
MKKARVHTKLSHSHLVAGRSVALWSHRIGVSYPAVYTLPRRPFRPDLAYSHANEAVRLDASSDAAIVLRRHALYKLMPSKRCIDNAARLCEQAEELKARGELREAYNMFYGAYRWHPSARSLYGIMRVAFTG